MVNRIMFWVNNINDLSTIRKLGCDGVHHPTFDGMTPEQQIAWMSKCEGLGLQVGWSALGGSPYAKEHREETIKRWKDSPLVSHVILIGDAQGVPVQEQIDKYNLFKGWAPDILFGIDRGFWSASDGDYWSEDAFDILFPHSYPYQSPHSVDYIYERQMLSMDYHIEGTYPIIPLLQCFVIDYYYNPREEFEPSDPEYSDNYMKYQYDRLETLFQPKGWWYDSIGFYAWSASYDLDIKRSPVMQTEVALLIKYKPLSHPIFISRGGIMDHGELSGLLDDDHTQYLLKSGGTMTGLLTLSAAPTSNLHASTKKYVDDQLVTKELFFGRLTSDQTIEGTDGEDLLIDTADVDTLSGFNADLHRYVIQNSGYFSLIAQMWIDGGVELGGYQVRIKINDAYDNDNVMAGWDWWRATGTSGDIGPRAFWPVKHLNAGDYIEARAWGRPYSYTVHGTENYPGHKTYLSVVELMRD